MNNDKRRLSKAEQAERLRARLKTLDAELRVEEDARLRLFGSEVRALLESDADLRAALLPRLQKQLSVKNRAQLAPLLLPLSDVKAPESPPKPSLVALHPEASLTEDAA